MQKQNVNSSRIGLCVCVCVCEIEMCLYMLCVVYVRAMKIVLIYLSPTIFPTLPAHDFKQDFFWPWNVLFSSISF